MWSSGESILGRGTTSAEVADVRAYQEAHVAEAERQRGRVRGNGVSDRQIMTGFAGHGEDCGFLL